MIGYKLMILERRTTLGVSEHTPPVVGQAHSLEHHFGAFMRIHTRRYTEKIIFWIKTVCVPAVVSILRTITILIVRIIKYIGTTVSHRVNSLGNEHTPRNGASSFFLKDITEHKKNLKNGNEH